MQNILIIKPSSLGDIVHGLQVACAIKQQRPNIHITWVVRDVFAPIVNACGGVVDRIIPFSRSYSPRKFFKCIKAIRQKQYDAVLDFQGLARTGLMTLCAKAKRKIGRSDAREGSKWCYTEVVPLPSQENPHALDILKAFLPQLGLLPRVSNYLPWEFSHVPFVNGTFLRQDYHLLFPNSRRPEKEWPHFVELTDRLLNEFPNKAVVWVGTTPLKEKDSWKSKQFYNFIGKTSLQDMITLLHFSNLVITNDSGPMHLSATLGKDLIALFGPTNPQRFGPYPITHPKHRIFKSDAMVDISVESVLETVKDIFTRRDQAIPKSIQPNLYLVGFMGTGKSTLGRFLAKILKMQFVDSDEFIEVKERMSVEEIFEHKGEAYFREQESAFFLSGHPSYGCIVACGGAIPLSQDIISSLKSKGIVIGLFASSEKILQQTNRKSHRPLLNAPDMNQKQRIEELLSQHEKFYMSAHYCLNSEGRSPLELSKRIVHLYTQKLHS